MNWGTLAVRDCITCPAHPIKSYQSLSQSLLFEMDSRWGCILSPCRFMVKLAEETDGVLVTNEQLHVLINNSKKLMVKDR